MRDVRLKLFPHQRRFITSKKPIVVLCGGRGCGKTEAAEDVIDLALLKGERCLVTAQTYSILKKNIFSRVVSGMYDKFVVKPRALQHDMQIDFGKGSAFFWSADTKNPDSVRGLDKIKKLVMDEAALAEEEFYQICSATLRGAGDPQIFLMTTPRGHANWVSRLRGREDVEWISATTYDNKSLGESYFKLMESIYTGKFAKQELFGEILDGEAVDSFFKASEIFGARDSNSQLRFGRDIIGVDVARFGDDTTTIWKRVGYVAEMKECLEQSDTFQILDAIYRNGNKETSIVCIDGTGNQAAGVVDILRRQGWDVREIMYNGESPDKIHYFNKRTWLFAQLREAARMGMNIPDDPKLLEELQAIRYFMAGQGQVALVPKEQTKKELGRSPDRADGLAITFAASSKDDPFETIGIVQANLEADLQKLFETYR